MENLKLDRRHDKWCGQVQLLAMAGGFGRFCLFILSARNFTEARTDWYGQPAWLRSWPGNGLVRRIEL